MYELTSELFFYQSALVLQFHSQKRSLVQPETPTQLIHAVFHSNCISGHPSHCTELNTSEQQTVVSRLPGLKVRSYDDQ